MSLRLAPRRTPVLLQSETSECGLVCIAMIASRYGLRIDLPAMRRMLTPGGRGASMDSLLGSARRMGLDGRALRLELDELTDLQLPAILHWQFDHYVVLTAVRWGRYHILDPASGQRRLHRREVDRAFTGVALELVRGEAFQPSDQRARLRLRSLLHGSRGLGKAAVSVLALSVLIQIVALLAPQYLQWTVDEALVRGDASLLGVLALAFAGLVLIRVGLEAGRSLLVLHAGSQLALHLSTRLFEHLLRLPLPWFERRSLGDVVSRIGSLAPVRTLVTESGVLAVVDALMALATGAMMFLYSPALTLLAIVVVVIYAAVRLGLFPIVRRRSHEQIAARAREETHVLETLRSILPIKVFGLRDQRAEGWRVHNVDALNRDIALARLGIGMLSVRGVLFGLSGVAIVYFAARQVLEGTMTVGMVFAFVSYQSQFSDRMGTLVERLLEWRTVSVHLERLSDIALEAPEASELEPQRDLALEHVETAGRVAADLELIGVGLRYGDEPWLFRDLDLQLHAGEFLAIVGPSGSGKTSLIKILLGLVPPTEGELSCGGRQQLAALAWLRGNAAALLQDDSLLAGSLVDNIALFEPSPDLARVQAAAMAAAVHDEIVRLPMGYRTEVGDLGSTLSGGQRQRVLLARALYRQPGLLVLDEGTAHLDPESASAVLDVVSVLPITRVLVTHDAKVAARADRVVELRGGVLLEAQQLGAQGAEVHDANGV